jgi:cytochrome c oxidase assembly factor CtaG
MLAMRARSLFARSVVVVAPAVWLAAAGPVAAHGPAPAEAPSIANLLLGWTFEPLPTLAIGVALGWWWWAVRRVDAAHPAHPVPRRRTVAFVAAQVALGFALLSGIARYDTTLFSVHMVQHVLLMLVAAPLIALSAPITLLLRVSSHETRRRWILPVLHSRIVRALSFPVVGWVLFAAVMWIAHFSPLFNAALEDPLLHDLEHLLFLSVALIFWWPAVALDPAPWRMDHPVRVVHLFMEMTQNTFLAVVILNVSTVMYAHYETVVRSWGPTPLEDQRLAAGIMWVAGDLVFIAAIMAVVAGWVRFDAMDVKRVDRQAAADMAAIRVRERRLAERLADERGESRS